MDSSSDPALRIPARSKCRRIRFRHWEAGLSAEYRGTRRLNSTTATTSESSGVRTADRNEEGTACLSRGRSCSKVLKRRCREVFFIKQRRSANGTDEDR